MSFLWASLTRIGEDAPYQGGFSQKGVRFPAMNDLRIKDHEKEKDEESDGHLREVLLEGELRRIAV